MSKNLLYRLSGGALIGSFVLSLAGGMAHPVVDGESHSVAALTAPASPYAQLLIYVGALLLMLGLPAMFVFLAPHVGKIGMAGIAGYFLANAVTAQGHLVVEAFVAPAIASDPAARHLIADDGSIVAATGFQTFMLAGAPLFLLSLLLMGIGLYRSGIVPRWVGVLLIAGTLINAVPLPEVPVLAGVQVEFARGLAVAVVGTLMIRAARRAPAASVPARVLQEV